MKRISTKNRGMKKVVAAIAAAAMIMTSALPAAAGSQVETYQSPYGLQYTVDYSVGAVDLDGVHVYLGLTADSTYVKIGGWKWACAVKADELAALAVLDPAWWGVLKSQYPTIEDHYAWKNRK